MFFLGRLGLRVVAKIRRSQGVVRSVGCSGHEGLVATRFGLFHVGEEWHIVAVGPQESGWGTVIKKYKADLADTLIRDHIWAYSNSIAAT